MAVWLCPFTAPQPSHFPGLSQNHTTIACHLEEAENS